MFGMRGLFALELDQHKAKKFGEVFVGFNRFWPMYLRAHRRAATRALHYIATVIGVSGAVAALATGVFWLFPLGIALGYMVAVLSHWTIEGNQPLITVNAFWGAVADLRMCYLAFTGQLETEALRHGVVLEIRGDKQGDVVPAVRD
jgi:hypothetical protein